MPDPRYGVAPGFGGGYDDPSKGEFQPGTESGVADANAGRDTARLHAVSVKPYALLHTVSVKPNAALYSVEVAPGA